MTSNQEHAARLRQIAADLLGMDSDSADVPALLAGAEALERLEAMESTSSTMLPKSTSVSEEACECALRVRLAMLSKSVSGSEEQ
jgi:hypothetical protein